MRRVLAGAVLLLALPASAAGQEPPTRDCGWQVKVAGDLANVLYPDEAARVVRRGVVSSRGRSGRVLFGVRRGRVRWVAVRAKSAPRSGRGLRRLLRHAGLR